MVVYNDKESRREGRDCSYRPQAENARYQGYISETDEPEHILNSSLSPATLIHKQIKSTTTGGQTALAGYVQVSENNMYSLIILWYLLFIILLFFFLHFCWHIFPTYLHSVLYVLRVPSRGPALLDFSI